MNTIALIQRPERFRVQIGSRVIEFETYYVKTTDSWKLNLYENKALLVAGIGLLNGFDILQPYNLNLGALTLVNILSTRLDANSQTLGASVILVHMTDEEYKDLILIDSDVEVALNVINLIGAPYLLG